MEDASEVLGSPPVVIAITFSAIFAQFLLVCLTWLPHECLLLLKHELSIADLDWGITECLAYATASPTVNASGFSTAEAACTPTTQNALVTQIARHDDHRSFISF